ncbi:hypothetical protein AQUCO_02500127v1 [Aquilegia coerulea]|uniref:Uncharacterized protein n=1 Tax=Aquilegia coerulea TaxID=218851 RepID=A0A2G5D9Q0_AQUCA|nr:hypothetical protein AQUCO_02500127v1 [Aquilegia coerulea]
MNLIQRCTNIQQFKTVHAIFITHGYHHNNYAVSKLIYFCAFSNSGHNLSYASLLFHQTPKPNSFIYNTLIRAYSRSSQPQHAFHYFNLMVKDEYIVPDHHTFPFVLIACANACSVSLGKRIHCWVLKNGLGFGDCHIQTALLRFYIECGSLVDVKKVFDEIPQRDVVQYNVFINGYLRYGMSVEALGVFRDMLCSEVEPDGYCVATGLTACAHSGALRQGIWIHEYIKKKGGFCEDVFVGTALVDMYAKCGCIGKAIEVFEGMWKRNEFSWAAMIGGYAVHGYAREAIQCLERMRVEDGLRPDEVVLLTVLTACTHAGLEEEGWFLLNNMKDLYGVVPKHEHYSCTVDLLCRGGRLDEALELIQKMPMKPLASVWGSMLSACKIQGNIELAELAVEKLLQLEHHNGAEEDGAYVQLSNIYLNAQRVEDARRVRKIMDDRRIKKTPGCSVVEVNGEVNVFIAGDVAHPLHREINSILDLISLHINDQPCEDIKFPSLAWT